VLVELGYLSSKRDLDLLQSEAWRADVTGGMANAIDAFFANRTSLTRPVPPRRSAAIAPVSP
jgi:N-acetylmuramoyl-L-alanine amidase